MTKGTLAAVAAEAAEGVSKPSTPAATTAQPTKEPAAKEPEASAGPAKDSGQTSDLDAVRQQAAAAERTRLMALDAIALPGCEAIITAAKNEGKSPEQAALEMVRHIRESGQLDISRQMATAAATVPTLADAPHDPVGGISGPKPKAGTEEAWRAEFAASDRLQEEFASADDYVAYKKSEAAGRVRVLKSGKEG